MRYANLAEVMMYENQVLADAGWGPVELPHGASDIELAWKVWVLEEPLEYRLVKVPKMFMTDFASIPKILRWMYDPVGAPYQVAAIFHDYLYSSVKHVTRAEADAFYYDVARRYGTSKLTASLHWMALRVGGWMAWRSNRKRLKADGPTWRILGSSWSSWMDEA